MTAYAVEILLHNGATTMVLVQANDPDHAERTATAPLDVRRALHVEPRPTAARRSAR